MVKDYTPSDSRTFNLSLIASLSVVFLVTTVEIVIDICNKYGSEITPFLAKIAIAGVLLVFLIPAWKQWNKERVR